MISTLYVDLYSLFSRIGRIGRIGRISRISRISRIREKICERAIRKSANIGRDLLAATLFLSNDQSIVNSSQGGTLSVKATPR